jgi:hypothetical protein
MNLVLFAILLGLNTGLAFTVGILIMHYWVISDKKFRKTFLDYLKWRVK